MNEKLFIKKTNYELKFVLSKYVNCSFNQNKPVLLESFGGGLNENKMSVYNSRY